jgi:hypothetical protein
MHRIGVSILTNGTRLESLQACVSSFLSNCHYRPLVIGVFDNGSTDGTQEWLQSQGADSYAIEWRGERSENDVGCAAGTNKASALVGDCEYVIHLESDFRHLTPPVSGCSRRWLHDALDFMDTGCCDFLYLRRMLNEWDIAQHWWSQWADKITQVQEPYMECPGFWWSNNPHLRRNQAVYDAGCLPLRVDLDGPKGTSEWGRPELSASPPSNTWLHKWGLFVHDAPSDDALLKSSCPLPDGCKYGFFKPGPGRDMFCQCCRPEEEYRHMDTHFNRFKSLC